MEKFLYDDMLNLPYPNPEIERDFPDKVLRAAQFAPFAALTGYDAAVAETARLTEEKTELAEDAAELLNLAIRRLEESGTAGRGITVRYFVPDSKKEGGAYRLHTGTLIEVRDFEKELVFEDGAVIPLDAVTEIE